MYQKSVRVYPNRQFLTGGDVPRGGFLPEEIYAQALDALVICCVDAAILCEQHWLLARRAQEPHPDWWVIGGRMRKGERMEQALRRTLRRELGIDLPEERLLQIVGYYQLMWDSRAQPPREQGCHLLSILTAVQLTAAEKRRLSLNEEYTEARWIKPAQVIEQAEQYHPCLVQMARDLLAREQQCGPAFPQPWGEHAG